jgi:hypothetical protein
MSHNLIDFLRAPLVRGSSRPIYPDPTMIRDFREIMLLKRTSRMRSPLLHASFMSAIFLAAGTANIAVAQPAPDLKARCNQLIWYYDRYAVGGNENSDGVRNHTRIAAALDCEKGNYETGISAMEALLKDRQIGVPPATTGIAQSPEPLKPHGEKRRTAQ